MAQLNPTTNPFALMMDPQAVVRAMESSERLARLKSRICRPLDKPLGESGSVGDEVGRFDTSVESDPTADCPVDAKD